MSAIGSTRNLTAQFVRYRSEAKRARGPGQEAYGGDDHATAKLLGAALGGDSADIEMAAGSIGTSFVPSWLARSEKIKSDMTQLKGRISKLKEYHSKALLVTFDSDNTASSHVDVLTREVQEGFKRLDGEIRGMGTREAGPDDDAQVRLQVQRQLAQALFKLSVDFRKEETRFLNKMEAQKGLAAGSSIGLIEDEGHALGASDPGFTESQIQKVSQAEVLIEERDEEIRKIVETIAELAQIMRDLSTLVVEQGTMLDRIDTNITQAAVKVEEGVKELVRAEKTQKQGRALLCIIALIVMIVVMLIVIIVRHI